MSQRQLESGDGAQFGGRRIGLVVDHPRRDLEGLVHLARALLARGHQPLLVPMYQQGIDQALLGLDAIVVNYYRPNNADALREWRADGLATFVLDTEGGVLSEEGHDSPPAFARALAGLRVEDGVDGYLFWGEKLANAVTRLGALTKERTAVTGCPRFDLCAEPWRRRLGPRRCDYVLINTNFSLINPAQTSGVEQETDVMIAGGWSRDYVQTLVTDMREVFRAYLACLDKATAALPNQRFRIRPHPFEDQGLYLARFGGRPNVEINGAGSVAAAIQRAKCVVHLNCGSAIEAAMLDRMPMQLEFLNTPVQRAHAPLPARVSQPTANLEELIRVLQSTGDLAQNFDLAGAVDRELKPYFGALDGSAADRAAAFVDARLAALHLRLRKRPLGVALRSGRRAASAGQMLQGVLGTLLGSVAAARLREAAEPARRAKRLDLHRIEGTLAELATCDAGIAAKARRARHPVTGLPMESILIEPDAV